ALRAAIVCVGLSGVLLGAFALLTGSGVHVASALSIGAGVFVALLGATRWPASTMSRPWRIVGFWALVGLLALELMIPLNYATTRRGTTWDWTALKLRSLSDRTVKVLSRVDKPLYVTTFFERGNPLHEEMRDVVVDLLDEYHKVNPNVVIEHIDPAREHGRFESARRRLDLDELTALGGQPRMVEVPAVVFQYDKRRKAVMFAQLLPAVMPGAEPMERRLPRPEEIVFAGEQLFTSAVVQVTSEKQRVLYFVTSHRELSPDGDLLHYANQFRRDNYRVESYDRLSEGVPQDCSVLIIMGSQLKFTDREVDTIRRHLGAGGKLFVALVPGVEAGLEPTFGEYGFNIGRDIIYDDVSGVAEPVVEARVAVGAWSHPVTASLRRVVFRFYGVRSVEEMPRKPGILGRDYVRAQNLLVTRPTAWGETDFASVARGRPVRDPSRDKEGPLGVAAVHEQPDVDWQGKPFPDEMPRTRIIVVGSPAFVPLRLGSRTLPIPEGNVVFFYNAIHWLAEAEELVSIPPRPFGVRPLDRMDAADAQVVFWLTAAGMPAGFLLLGGVIWLVRRRT
ncbi:MAG TPA: GldG family protein, partial [Planctomycetota bacterium]|nr:GldG family protein [Planctomycetota bacterium]